MVSSSTCAEVWYPAAVHTLLLPSLAFVLTVLLHCGALYVFPKLQLLDFPERYGLTRKRLPYPSGILGVIVFVAFSPFLFQWSFRYLGLLIAVVVLATLCFLDDRYKFSWKIRLPVQLLIGAGLFLSGVRLFTLTNPLEGLTGIPVLSLTGWSIPSELFANPSIVGLLFTMAWLLLNMNALNWFDGIPGQVTILSTIGFTTIGLLSLSARVNQPSLAVIAFVLAAIAFGSFLFDVPPPRVVLGDTGAMVFGLLLGTLTIYAGGKVATAFLVLGVPLLDSMLVIGRRLLRRRSPFEGSQKGEHLHHRLLECGWSPRQVIALTSTIGLLFGITALFLSTTEKFIAAILLAVLMLLISIAADSVRTTKRLTPGTSSAS